MTQPDLARNQFAAWREDLRRNAFLTDTHLQSLLRWHGREATPGMVAFGARTTTDLDEGVRESNRDEHLPRLRRYDDQGHRLEQVTFHPSYHDLGRALYGTGLMSFYAEPGRELETLVYTYLYALNGEAGHTCPLACTAGLIKILQADEAPHAEWLQRLLDPDYDTHFHGSQFLTEVQGGSDVGSNAVQALQDTDGTWRIHGEKWFCSVIDAHLFLLTARPAGEPSGTRGLRAFVVPRTLPDGSTNHFAIRRLKYKLGTRSMASAEVDFQGAVAVPVGDFHRVVSVVLNTSRLYNAIASCGMIQRAAREAHAYARTRAAFGQPILAFPAVARIVARLRVEAYANRGLTFYLAHLADRRATGHGDDTEAAAWRMLVNLNKYWTSHVGTSCLRDAIEVFGGNGAIEEFTVLPRLLRDSIVCEQWEGTHNVLCAQALKDSRRLGLHQPMFDLLQRLGGPDPRLTTLRERWQRTIDAPDTQASLFLRDLIDDLRPLAQACVLKAEAAHPGSDPALPLIIEHLTAEGPDGLYERIQALVA